MHNAHGLHYLLLDATVLFSVAFGVGDGSGGALKRCRTLVLIRRHVQKDWANVHCRHRITIPRRPACLAHEDSMYLCSFFSICIGSFPRVLQTSSLALGTYLKSQIFVHHYDLALVWKRVRLCIGHLSRTLWSLVIRRNVFRTDFVGTLSFPIIVPENDRLLKAMMICLLLSTGVSFGFRGCHRDLVVVVVVLWVVFVYVLLPPSKHFAISVVPFCLFM